MKTVVIEYDNGHKRYLTVSKCQWANEDHTAAIMFTAESGAVLACMENQPDVFSQLEGLEFLPHAGGPKPSDEEIAEILLKREILARVKIMTEEEKREVLQ